MYNEESNMSKEQEQFILYKYIPACYSRTPADF